MKMWQYQFSTHNILNLLENSLHPIQLSLIKIAAKSKAILKVYAYNQYEGQILIEDSVILEVEPHEILNYTYDVLKILSDSTASIALTGISVYSAKELELPLTLQPFVKSPSYSSGYVRINNQLYEMPFTYTIDI